MDSFVAPHGNDSNAGTKANPFATLQQARDAVRAIKRRGPLPGDGISAWVRGGNCPLSHDKAQARLDGIRGYLDSLGKRL